MTLIKSLEVSKYLGVKFFYKGRGMGGIDCAGLCIKHWNLPDNIFEYDLAPTVSLIERELSKVARKVDSLAVGDIIVFNDAHIAIYSAEDTIIHTYKKIGKVVEHPLNYMWKKKIISIFRRK